MIGAIIGDIVGSRFEFHNTNKKKFELFTEECRFTDDTVMTLAVAESLMRSKKNGYLELPNVTARTMHEIGRRYPRAGYGGRFAKWMFSEIWIPYNSCGNGSAMRISAVGDIAESVEEAKKLSDAVTGITHNHPEGMKGAEAAAVAKVMLKTGSTLNQVESYINDHYYRLDKTVNEIRKETQGQHGKEICQVTMPQAFTCLFEGTDFEDVIRNCISIGGDSDTIAAIAGGIAEAVYPVPEEMKKTAKKFLTRDLRDIAARWERFTCGKEG